mmetsp:Transcript_132339/g.229471  ORF Transcript_132339/g.229471 Transcript_132339/m.229471 type:complete len:135 (+) Transcript_132339:61-465(+)
MMMGECVEYMNLIELFRRCDLDGSGIVQWADLQGILYSPFDTSTYTGQKYLKRLCHTLGPLITKNTVTEAEFMSYMAKLGMVFSASQFDTIVKSASHIAAQECKVGLFDGWVTREQRHEIWDVFKRMDKSNTGA